MIPARFEYHAPTTLRQAVAILRRHDGDARVLAGGMSLIPMMKLRLANPSSVVDLRRIDGLAFIRKDGDWREDGDGVVIGATTTYHEIESSALVRERASLIAAAASVVGDVQVRNKGTIGGSAAHADPAADMPAVLLASDARIHVAGGPRRRTIPAARFFLDAYTTALADSEIITEITLPASPPRTGSSYQKLANKASRFAVVGVAVQLTLSPAGDCERVRIGVTGAGPAAVRARGAERYLTGREPSTRNLEGAAQRASRGIECLGDIHGSPDYREHLTRELTRRALAEALRSVAS